MRGNLAGYCRDQALVEFEWIQRCPLQVQLFCQFLHKLRGVDVSAQQQFTTQAPTHRVGHRRFQLLFGQQTFFHQSMPERGALGLGQGGEFMGGLVPGHAA
ncbi:hypothetical protein D3C81_1624910 [compost metagenome]